MRARVLLPVLLFFLAHGPTAAAEAPALPPGDKEPVLRVEAGGPASFVTSLAFSADGQTLYAGGWDKVVRVWTLDGQGQFVPDRIAAYRLPVGPGLDGAIDALALSDDDVWLAAAGKSVFRDAAGFRTPGFVVPTLGGMTETMRKDMGTIYVFNTRDQSVRLLRGHAGTVKALAFAPRRPAQPPLLLSVAQEKDRGADTFHMVARLWDVTEGESVAALTGLPDAGVVRPGLAVWPTGGQGDQVGAALALTDGTLRVWDVRNPKPWERKVVKNNESVAYLRDPPRLLTADYGDRQGRFTLWELPDGGEPRPLTEPPVPRSRADSYPRGLGLLSSRADGTPDLAATILAPPNGGTQFRLHVVALDPENLGTVRAEKLLWKGGARQPVLATSLRGRHVAVAGNAGHEIWIYALPSLLAKDKTPPQILRSSGVTFHHVSFASKGKGQEVALLLNRLARKGPGELPPAADPNQGDLLFDFSQRRLTADSAGWTTSTPNLGGWRVRSTEEGPRPAVIIEHDGRILRQITVEKGQELSDYALLPPHGDIREPLLALATHEAGQPQLALYNAASGELLRHFRGHVDRLYALAFSADGRLLVSTAEDQTVCVWSLTDLKDVLGRRGRLPGVKVQMEEGVLKVAEVPPDSPAGEVLRPGDVLAGLVEKGKLRPLTSALAFYDALFRMAPGQKVILRRGDPQGNDDLTLDVGQGADEQKPLLSLFVIRDEKSDKVEDGEWIGWSPLGPYDASSRRAERFLGWQFNTGDVKSPTRFVLAAAHQKEYYKKGILQKLVSAGALVYEPDPPLPPPTLVMLIEEDGRHRSPEPQGPLLVRHAQVKLKLAVLDRPLNTLEAVTWKLDNGAEVKLDLDGANAGRFVAPLDLRRGDHKVVVTAWTQDVPPQPISKHLALSYQPPAPLVELKEHGRQLDVKEPVFDLKAAASARLAGEAFEVTLHQWSDRKDLLAEGPTHTSGPNRLLPINQRVQLRPGNNRLEVVAVNRDAPPEPGPRERETDRKFVDVFYTKKAPPPVIALTGVLPLPAAAGQVLQVEPLQPLVVHAPRVRVLGRIEASEDLLRAEWDQGQPAGRVGLSRFEPSKVKEFNLQEEVTLQPGRQTLHFQARTATSDLAERDLILDYQPLLPTVHLTPPRSGPVLYGDKETAVVHLQGRIELPEDRRAYRAVVVRNDKEVAAAPVIDERAGTWTADVVVEPGDNRIRLRLSNAWGAVSDGEETLVRYLRPPHILDLKQVGADGKAVLNLEASVRSPLPLLRESVRVKVNGLSAPVARIVVGETVDGVQVVRLEEVPLEAGSAENKIQLWVSNAEAECREPGAFVIRTSTVLPPPEIEVLEPGQNQLVSRSELTVRFRVRSVSPLTLVRLVVPGQPARTADLAGARREAGRVELPVEMNVELARGPNYLHVEAVNASGRRTSPPLVVTYEPPPLRVVLDHLVPIDKPGGQPVWPRRQPGGRMVFPDGVAHGHVELHGWIAWGDDKAARANGDLLLRFYVNGFQQLPVRAKPVAGGNQLRTPFVADLLLNWPKGNHVSVAALGQDANDRSEFWVDCGQPVTQQRLHLLTLSPRGKDAAVVKAEVLKAVQTSQPLAFQEVKEYGPLVGSMVWPPFIWSRLLEIQETILLTRPGASANDVVIVYYQGGEAVKKDGNFFQTYAGQAQDLAKEFGIPCDELVGFLVDTPGAHVLLLDVDRAPLVKAVGPGEVRDKIVRWKDEYPQAQAHVGVMRHAWLGKTDPPLEARLIPLLGKALSREARLKEVVGLLRQSFASLTHSNLVIYLPDDFPNLLVGGGR